MCIHQDINNNNNNNNNNNIIIIIIISHKLTTEGNILSVSKLGPSCWPIEASEESVELSDDCILVSLILLYWCNLTVTTCELKMC